MPRAVHLSPAAEEDLEAIRAWFSQPGAGSRAKMRRRAIAQAIRDLTHYPCRYPTGDHPGVHEWPVERHRVMYSIVPDTEDDRMVGDVLVKAGDVQVLRVFGPGQSRASI